MLKRLFFLAALLLAPGLARAQQAAAPVQLVPRVNSGLSISSAISAASDNATSVKASAGQVYHIDVFNNSTNIAYLKLYNKATAPTCGTDTPVARYLIPANASGTGAVIEISNGLSFSTGIGYCLVTGIADNDDTGVSANAYLIDIGYK